MLSRILLPASAASFRTSSLQHSAAVRPDLALQSHWKLKSDCLNAYRTHLLLCRSGKSAQMQRSLQLQPWGSSSSCSSSDLRHFYCYRVCPRYNYPLRHPHHSHHFRHILHRHSHHHTLRHHNHRPDAFSYVPSAPARSSPYLPYSGSEPYLQIRHSDRPTPSSDPGSVLRHSGNVFPRSSVYTWE